ncbi:putative cytidine deaminase [Tupanvirus soda lake]|uniref:Cytidine deaminase n=2 Tax=Tupanvirus TaxID=2094720 RepID=A0AC62ACU5_9VIRU|nr:putative cytidine deaminase [Tupanvirus soda lake]QKU35615.1 putative cytidine deaminase [Tupanvirus soda lake]
MKMRDFQYENNRSCNHHYNKKLSYTEKSTHAEEMAIDKLKKNKKRKLISVSLLVIRISYGSTVDVYNLSNSRPCVACMSKIKNLTNFGYKVTKVYFSNENGDIVCYKLRDILKEKQYLSKFYRVSTIPRSFMSEFDVSLQRNKPQLKYNNSTANFQIN